MHTQCKESSLSSQLDIACAQVCCTSHICTGYCATVINGTVYILRKDQLTYSVSHAEVNVSELGSSFRLYCKGASRKYETDTVTICGY